ncbi:putative nuclease HARBI1 [Trichonephila clavipes]|nr:putative nuclease HARBI1 [Trichonephila clavipes]
MKEGLIASSYVCPKCGKPMELRERTGKSVNDFFEWMCRNQSSVKAENHYVSRSVCELHFSDDAIRRYTEAYNEKTGEKICVPLKRYRLQDFAVPTIFTDFPTYLSNSGNPTRECPEKRLQRLENEHLQRSIQASIISKEEFEKNKSFTSFPELVECLNAEEFQDIWTVCKNDLVIIMMLDTIISPVIKASVIINKDLHLTIHIGQTKIDQLGKYKFHNTIVVNEILHELALRIEMKSSHDFPTAFGFIVNRLEIRRSNLFEELDDYEFQRIPTKQSVAGLTLLIEEKLESKTPCKNVLNPLEQVLIALRFYAVACMQLAIADLFDVSQPTVCRVVHRVSEAIASLLPDFIHLPVNREECKTVSRKFFSIAGFPKVIGALDGTFVRIVSPGGEDAERFRCRKNYFALNVQTIVDSDLVIRNVVARWPGSAHVTALFSTTVQPVFH